MSTARDYLKEDMEKRPEQLQREADEVRADMEHTVDDLMNRLSPDELINLADGGVETPPRRWNPVIWRKSCPNRPTRH